MKGFKQLALWILVFFVMLMVFYNVKKMPLEQEIPYSEFKRDLRKGDIANVSVRADLIRGEYKTARAGIRRFRTLPLPDSKLVEDLETFNVATFSGEVDRSWMTSLLINVGWIVLFFVLWWVFIIRQVQMGGKQALSFGRSRTVAQDAKKQKTTFKDVAACEEAKEDLMEIVEFLKDPKKFQKLGGRIPRGVLLYGLPGTGKTLLARAVAGEARVPFYSASGSEFVEMFVGVGASRVRDLFEKAKKSAPAVVFIDELDAVGRHRFAGIGGGHDEREQTLNQLLVELDGFDTKEGVILLAATNRPDVLDPALLRPGRFDRQINVAAPDLNGREAILKVHSKRVKLADEKDLKIIAQRTPGFVGSDLANVVNESALLAARRNKHQVELEELEESIERVMSGPQRKSRVITDKEKRIVAYHESGHTLVAKLLPGSDPVHKVSIIPRGPSLGYTLQLPTEDRYLVSRREIMNKLYVLLGGRCAEEIVFDDVTTGAHDDLSKATLFAQRMIMEYGMSDRIGPMSLKKKDEEVFLGRDIARGQGYSEQTAQIIDEEVKRILTECQAKVRDMLQQHRHVLDSLAARLVEKEHLDADEITALTNVGLSPA
ncbi:MAG: ATP-dependent metallopeptidase FtsH/Yme1/Tma family protein [Elusimicrobia bacterium]|nr:ATP-dependent metallopeptidase FtsH/Yme1/Tma family protein [Elusimicrobiota bacterium]